MNKRTIITIIMAMCLMFTACGQTENTERNDVTDTGSPQAQEQNDNARPAYAGEVPDLSQYSTIFIGAPVWWGDWPMIRTASGKTSANG